MAVTLCNGCPTNAVTTCMNREVCYKDAVLDTYEVNGYDDSDFRAVVWDEEDQRLRSIMYASTRSWTYHDGARIDASVRVQVRARFWLFERYTDYYMAQQRIPAVDAHVRSLTTRGKAKGATGRITRIITSRYRAQGKVARVEAADGTAVWVGLDRLEVTDSPDRTWARERAESTCRVGAQTIGLLYQDLERAGWG